MPQLNLELAGRAYVQRLLRASLRTITWARRRISLGGQRIPRPWDRWVKTQRNAMRLRRLERTKQPIALFFAYEAGLVPFLASHAILAKTRAESGHASIMLSCDGLLPYCNVKIAMGLPPNCSAHTRNAACAACCKVAASTQKSYDLPHIALDTLLGSAERDEIERIIAANANDPAGVIYDGVRLGSLVVGEVLRVARKSEPAEFTDQDREMVRALLFSSLAIYVALQMMASRYSIERIIYFGDYAPVIGAQIYAEREGIAVTRITHLYNRDVDRRMISMQQTCGNIGLLEQLDSWPEYRDQPIEPSMVSAIADGALYRLTGHGGASTYSPNWMKQVENLEGALGLSRDRKTVVAYTSSVDEFVASRGVLGVMGRSYAAGPRPFEDQFAWLKALVAWAEARSDLQLVIRIHPRTGTGRFSTVASEYFRLKSDLAVCPPNVVVIWPEDPVSSYNLAEIADAVLVGWSTLGLECARFGIPVIAAFSGIGSFPTGSFIAFEETRQGYFAALEHALTAPASLQNIAEAYRWTHYAFWAPVVDVSDLVPQPDYSAVPPWQTPRNSRTILRVLNDNEDLASINMKQLPRGRLADIAEHQSLNEAMDRTAVFFMTGEDRAGARLEQLTADKAKRIVSAVIDGQRFERYSPLVYRFAEMRKSLHRLDPTISVSEA